MAFSPIADLAIVNYLSGCFARHTLWIWSPMKGTWLSVLFSYCTILRKWLFRRVTDF